MAETQSLNKDAKALEDAFFAEENRRLLDRLRDQAAREEKRKLLKAALEVDDDALVNRLMELGLSVETVVAFGLVPLVEVAWADGEIHGRERAAILEALEAKGAQPGGIAYSLVENWLLHKPGPELMDAWKHYASTLSSSLDADRMASLKQGILAQTNAVAEAAGGFLGFGDKVSDAERKVLEQLEWALG